jgi:hypothetical protein
MSDQPKMYIDRELYYLMNAAGYIQFAKDRTMVLCIPGIPEARVIVGEKPSSAPGKPQIKVAVRSERDPYVELDELHDDVVNGRIHNDTARA